MMAIVGIATAAQYNLKTSIAENQYAIYLGLGAFMAGLYYAFYGLGIAFFRTGALGILFLIGFITFLIWQAI